MKRKIHCGKLSLEITLLGLPHIVKAAFETWPNPRVKVNSAIAESFQQEPCWEMDGNNKDQLRDVFNYLN